MKVTAVTPIAAAIAVLPSAIANSQAQGTHQPPAVTTNCAMNRLEAVQSPTAHTNGHGTELSCWIGLEQLAGRGEAANEAKATGSTDAVHDSDERDFVSEERALVRNKIAARFLAAREVMNGLSQTEGATLLGYKKSGQLSQIESGKKAPPLSVLVRASDAYSVSTDYLLGLSDEPERQPAAALRSALRRSVRNQLDAVVDALADRFDAHATMRHVLRVREFITAVGELLAAVEIVERAAGFAEDVRGGATLVRRADHVRDLHHAMRQAIQRHERDDLQLRRQLAAARAQGPRQADDEAAAGTRGAT